MIDMIIKFVLYEEKVIKLAQLLYFNPWELCIAHQQFDQF